MKPSKDSLATHLIWCICCKQVVTAGKKTIIMKTAYHLTVDGPISYGCCDACADNCAQCRKAGNEF